MQIRAHDNRDGALNPLEQRAAEPSNSQAHSVEFADGHTDSIAQMKLRDLASGGAQTKGAAAHKQRIENSPLIGSQRAVMQRLTGGASRKPIAAGPSYATSLPRGLQRGIEQLSGVPLDGVSVRYNSGRPATFDALATTTGSTIELGPGQEASLPHEAWHAAQQRQGRVEATTQMNGVAVNDQQALEQEADVMGARAQHGDGGTSHADKDSARQTESNGATPVVQRANGEKTSSHSGEAAQQGGQEHEAMSRFLGEAATLFTTIDEVMELLAAREVDAKALALKLTALSAAKVALGAAAVALGVAAIVLTAGGAAIPLGIALASTTVSATGLGVAMATGVAKKKLDQELTPDLAQDREDDQFGIKAAYEAYDKWQDKQDRKDAVKEVAKVIVEETGGKAAAAFVGPIVSTAAGAWTMVEGAQAVQEYGNFDSQSVTKSAWNQLSALSQGLQQLYFTFHPLTFADEECERAKATLCDKLYHKKEAIDMRLAKYDAPGPPDIVPSDPVT